MSGVRAVACVVLGDGLQRFVSLRFASQLQLVNVVSAAEGRQVAVLRLVL